MAEDGEIIHREFVSVEFAIREWNIQSGVHEYDWISDVGESDETYASIADARRAALDSLGQ